METDSARDDDEYGQLVGLDYRRCFDRRLRVQRDRYYLYREGKKRLNRGVLWTGVGVMIYPVFVNGALRMWMTRRGIVRGGVLFWTRDESP